jgi:hypothetical protein
MGPCAWNACPDRPEPRGHGPSCGLATSQHAPYPPFCPQARHSPTLVASVATFGAVAIVCWLPRALAASLPRPHPDLMLYRTCWLARTLSASLFSLARAPNHRGPSPLVALTAASRTEELQQCVLGRGGDGPANGGRQLSGQRATGQSRDDARREGRRQQQRARRGSQACP